MEIKKLIQRIKPYFKDQGGHGFDHTERVYNLAIRIAKDETVDMEVLKIACLLHDIARFKEDNQECECHAKEGARIAGEILKKENIDKNKIEHIQDCIRIHRYSKGIKAKSSESKILQDADRLDALGAICVARVFVYNGLHKIPLYDPKIEPEKEYNGQHTTAINHFYEKILKIKPESFHTNLAKEIAKERYDFIIKFLEQFKAEWEGKR